MGSTFTFWLRAAVGSTARHVEAPPSQESHLARLARGELAALGELYDEHHVHVRAFARRLLADDAAAEDLVQETFLEVPAAARRFRGDASLRTLLLSIAARRASRFVRSVARRRATLARLEREPYAAPRTPEDEVMSRERRAALLRALDTLSFDQRVALVLCDVEGRTSVEAGTILGVSEITVRTRLFAARKKLRAALEQEAP